MREIRTLRLRNATCTAEAKPRREPCRRQPEGRASVCAAQAGLMRGKSHHAPQKLRFEGDIAEGNPKGAQACARQRRGVGLYSTRFS